LTGEKRLETLFHAPGREQNPAVAPNGRFIAYDSDESSRSEVYVRPLPHAGSRKWQVSTEGGAGPVWTRGGNEIVYRDAQGRRVAVAVRSDGPDGLDFSKPQPLVVIRRPDQPPPPNPAMCRCWDVTADGQRFLVFNPTVQGNATEVELILIRNWTEELKRLVPLER
jgi:serine/threonine-protein kinase